jgi:hypothetical protein
VVSGGESEQNDEKVDGRWCCPSGEETRAFHHSSLSLRGLHPRPFLTATPAVPFRASSTCNEKRVAIVRIVRERGSSIVPRSSHDLESGQKRLRFYQGILSRGEGKGKTGHCSVCDTCLARFRPLECAARTVSFLREAVGKRLPVRHASFPRRRHLASPRSSPTASTRIANERPESAACVGASARTVIAPMLNK